MDEQARLSEAIDALARAKEAVAEASVQCDASVTRYPAGSADIRIARSRVSRAHAATSKAFLEYMNAYDAAARIRWTHVSATKAADYDHSLSSARIAQQHLIAEWEANVEFWMSMSWFDPAWARADHPNTLTPASEAQSAAVAKWESGLAACDADEASVAATQATTATTRATVAATQATVAGRNRIIQALGVLLVGAVIIIGLAATGVFNPSGQSLGGSTPSNGSGAPGGPPAGWVTRLCTGALFDLQDAGNHVQALSEAAANFDVSRATNEAGQVNDKTKEAQDILASMSDWAPGAPLRSDLLAEATDLRQAVNLFQIAVSANDAAGVRSAASLLDTATTATSMATQELGSLRSQYGFAC